MYMYMYVYIYVSRLYMSKYIFIYVFIYVSRLYITFKKFYGRHTDLVGQYKKNVCQMFADSIS